MGSGRQYAKCEREKTKAAAGGGAPPNPHTITNTSMCKAARVSYHPTMAICMLCLQGKISRVCNMETGFTVGARRERPASGAPDPAESAAAPTDMEFGSPPRGSGLSPPILPRLRDMSDVGMIDSVALSPRARLPPASCCAVLMSQSPLCGRAQAWPPF